MTNTFSWIRHISALSVLAVLYLFTLDQNLQKTVQDKHVKLNFYFGISYLAQH